MNTQRSVSRYGTSGRTADWVSARTLCATSTPVEPVRIDWLLTALPRKVGCRDLGADLGDIVVEFDKTPLRFRHAGAVHSRRGCVCHVSHWKYPQVGLRAAPLVRAQGSAKTQPFLFQGAEAIFAGGVEAFPPFGGVAACWAAAPGSGSK